MENERNPRNDSDEFGRATDEDVTGIGNEEFEEDEADDLDDEELEDADEMEGR